jgi:zinc protease
MRHLVQLITLSSLAALAACGGTQTTVDEVDGHDDGDQAATTSEREDPPPSGPARDVSFPPITRASTESGLEVNSVEWDQLPVVYLRLVIKSGGEADPADEPGMAHLVGAMLKEGTRSRPSARLAEEVEFLGADLWVDDDEENVYIGMRALSDHLDEAMEILADVAMNPAFRGDELAKLKRREIDRLTLQQNDPNFLASQAFYRHLYGEHPYARIDTTREVVQRVRRGDLARWHRQHFVPNNAALVAVGAVSNEQVMAAANEAFGRWRRGDVPEVEYPEPPLRESREVIVVDRPESVQSVIRIGNLALERDNPSYIPLRVANQILGGSAASRLFMDLRERRSLTYGAYSRVGEAVEVAPFSAYASVRNEVTQEAMQAFFEHLDRIVSEPAPEDELANAHRYLSDRFPLTIDTPGKIAYLVADLRVYGLPDDYWDNYRTSIRQVTSAEALAAAREDIKPERALVVVVGKAADIAAPLTEFGPVTIYDTSGEEVRSLPAAGAEAEGGDGDAEEGDEAEE